VVWRARLGHLHKRGFAERRSQHRVHLSNHDLDVMSRCEIAEPEAFA
jgi:hypothetical protein